MKQRGSLLLLPLLCCCAGGFPSFQVDPLLAEVNRQDVPPPIDQARPPPEAQKSHPFSITDSMVDFTVDMSTNYLPPGNTVFSPFSISSALSLLMLGSTDNTYEQLRLALKYPPSADDTMIHQQNGIQLQKLRRDDEGITVRIANRIFTDAAFDIEENYMRDARDFYQAGVEQLEFARKPDVATRRINTWISDNTQGKIPQLFDAPLPRTTRLIGTNVVYFNSSWQVPFDPQNTQPLTFHLDDKEKIKTNMMFNDLELPYAEYVEEKFRVLGLPYSGGEHGMYIFLPDEAGEQHLMEMERRLSAERMAQIITELQPRNISFWLPRFRMEHGLPLREVLQQMGVTDLFQQARASLLRLSSDRQLFVDDVLHQAVIDVNEAGTEAAAVTTTLVSRDRFTKEFRANRPFLFVIRDNTTGVPLFWGRMVRPEEPHTEN